MSLPGKKGRLIVAKVWGLFKYSENEEGELLVNIFGKKCLALREKDRRNRDAGKHLEYVVRGVKERELVGLTPPIVRLPGGFLVGASK